ncbi:hypothetical protein EVAR_44189_1 [Eumeta japonica]|uniref:Uncharacterized protein n=1 Tax=Eumeta variegata TaxID=151549 RepID=A0A4C1W0R0_EUMVA|nr:hypothetical protein EVAR_44189_1 [Eumeta japonica]
MVNDSSRYLDNGKEVPGPMERVNTDGDIVRRGRFRMTPVVGGASVWLRGGALTWRRPGTSPTAVPSPRTQMTSGAGEPRAAHSTTAPVVLLKSTLFGGSFMKIGPKDSSSAVDLPTPA